MINIKDFCDMEQFEQIMSNWAKATGQIGRAHV